jgi:very-short-patch-repair endonuclease
VIVELDGRAGHGYQAAVERDRARDLTIRAAGYRVLRYSWWQVTRDQERVVADLRRELACEPK